MKFTEKNDFLVKHTSGEHFSMDRELFKVHCPNSRLHADLKRINSFNKNKLDGLMLWELLEKISPEEILKNREEPAEIIIENIDQAKEILKKMEIDPGKVSEEFLSESIGKAAIAFESLMKTLKPLLVGENVSGISEDGKTSEEGFINSNASNESPLNQELDEKEEELTDKELDLEEKSDVNENEISDLRDELENKDTSIEELQKKTEALEKKAFNKKKANKKSSPQ